MDSGNVQVLFLFFTFTAVNVNLVSAFCWKGLPEPLPTIVGILVSKETSNTKAISNQFQIEK